MGSGIESAYGKLLMLAVSFCIAAAITFYTGKRLLKTDKNQTLPRPLMCALLWLLATCIIGAGVLLVVPFHLADYKEIIYIPIVMFILGFIYGGIFWLLSRKNKANAFWPQRALIGALLGLLLTLLTAVPVSIIFTGLGSGGHVNLGLYLFAALYVIWLIPLAAVFGVATPRPALIKTLHLKGEAK